DAHGAGLGEQAAAVPQAARSVLEGRDGAARPGLLLLRRREIGAAADPADGGGPEPERDAEPGLVTLTRRAPGGRATLSRGAGEGAGLFHRVPMLSSRASARDLQLAAGTARNCRSLADARDDRTQRRRAVVRFDRMLSLVVILCWG